MWRPLKLSNFQYPLRTPLTIYVQIFFIPLTLHVQFQMTTPLQMITNQLKEKIVQGWLLNVIRSFLHVGFRLQYQPINLVWLFFDFFPFTETSLLYLLLPGFIVLCVLLSKNIKKRLLFIIIHIFSTHFAIKLFFCATWECTNYCAAAAPYIWTNEIKTKTKPSHVTLKLTTRFIVQFTLKTMQWYD